MSPARDEMLRQELIALLPRLHRFALVLTKSAVDADDLVQATCERAISRLDTWIWGTALDRWLFKITPAWLQTWQGVGWARRYWVEDAAGPSFEEAHGLS